jgi:hypothetical protein
MYWCKRYSPVVTGLLLLNIVSCKQDSSANKIPMQFFDLKGYFSGEAARLAKLNPEISKTAVYNKQPETQKVHIANWSNELSMFTESDINKPAWRASYDVQSSDGFITYKAKDPELKTQDIVIKKNGNKIKWIFIYNHVRRTLFNMMLFESKETLTYFPDSLYQVQKRQATRVLGINTYNVKGVLN